MGIFDYFNVDNLNKAGDFLQTPQGNALLSGLATYAATARKNTPINNLGRGGLGYMMGYQNSIDSAEAQKQKEFENKIRQFQMDEAMAKIKERQDYNAQLAKFRPQVAGMFGQVTPGLSPEQASQSMPEIEAFGPEGLQGAMEYANQPNPAGQMLASAPDAILGKAMESYYGNAMDKLFPKPKDPIKLGAGDVLVDPNSYQPLFTAPNKDPEKDKLILMMQTAGIDPASPDGQKIVRDWITKQTTHAPAATANAYSYGTPMPVVDTRTGEVNIVQPTKSGEPPKVMEGYTTPEAYDKKEKSKQALNSMIKKTDNVLVEVDKAIKNVSAITTGIPGSILGQVPGTGAYDLRKTVQTIKANIGFQELQEMRQNSPTGGALGQVAVQELESLQATIANLDTSQSDTQLLENLKKVQRHYENWKAAVTGQQPNKQEVKNVKQFGDKRIVIDGKTYEVLERRKDGSIKIKDPKTGKTGVVEGY